MEQLLLQSVSLAAAQLTDTVIKQMHSPAYAFDKAMFTWLLAGIVAFAVAIIMKVLYVIMKKSRIKAEKKELNAGK